MKHIKFDLAEVIPSTNQILADLKIVLYHMTKTMVKKVKAGTDLTLSDAKTVTECTKSIKEIAGEERRLRADDRLATLSDEDLIDLIKGLVKDNPELQLQLLGHGEEKGVENE